MNSSRSDRMAAPKGLVPTRRRLATAGGLALGATLAMSGSANAATFTVTNLNDSGPGSLRDAIDQANANTDADTITFASGQTGTMTLTSGQMYIFNPVQILGPGPNLLTISGNNNERIFAMDTSGPGGPGGPVSISGLTLTAGKLGVGGVGGAVSSEFTGLTLANDVISGNTADDGAGIYVFHGSLNLQDSTVSGNTAVDGNTAGVRTYHADPVSIKDSTLSGNSGGRGGAYLGYGTQIVQGSTVTGNHATEQGGGLYSTYASSLTVTGSTIAGNSSLRQGGGIGEFQSPTTLRDSIVWGNSASLGGPDLAAVDTPPSSFNAAFSLIGDPSGATVNETVPGSNIIGADPQLGPLADNGGPTQTMALAASSPAVDKGSAFGLTTDQRGVQRPIEFPLIPNSTAPGADGADIGAFELQPSNAITLGKLKRHKKKGTAVQFVNLPLPDSGTLTLSGKGLKPQTKPVADNGVVKLKVIAKGKVRQLLKRKGKARTKETITYNATGQTPSALSKKIKLLKKLR